MTAPDQFTKPCLVDLQEDGILWAINRQVLHPRGFALAVIPDGKGGAAGFELLGDGLRPWTYATENDVAAGQADEVVDEADLLARFDRALARAAAHPEARSPGT